MSSKYNMLTILGPTAGGKTSVATRMAYILNGEVISADSRQVYRGMDLGTGKDLDDYIVEGKEVPYHLIDIVDAGYKYNVYEYQRDFVKVYEDIISRNKFPVFCGGSGMYLEAVLKGYKLINVPNNEDLRKELETKSEQELIELLLYSDLKLSIIYSSNLKSRYKDKDLLLLKDFLYCKFFITITKQLITAINLITSPVF